MVKVLGLSSDQNKQIRYCPDVLGDRQGGLPTVRERSSELLEANMNEIREVFPDGIPLECAGGVPDSERFGPEEFEIRDGRLILEEPGLPLTNRILTYMNPESSVFSESCRSYLP